MKFTMALLMVACGSAGTHTGDNKQQFTLPSIPQTLTSKQHRAAFLVEHYWDNFDFSDTTFITKPEITEQIFVDYINLFPQTSLDVVKKSIGSMLNRSVESGIVFDYFSGLYDKYLYDPNSLFRQEAYYIVVLQSIINSGKLDDIEKLRSRYRLEIAMKNRPGDSAANFKFIQKNGKSLYMEDVKAEYIVLFFNNPDCHECVRVKDILSQMTKSQLKIIAIYPDEDIELWKKTVYPPNWVNGRCRSIQDNALYDLRAIPNLYLLDKEKKVLLKDVPVEMLVEWINKNLKE